MDTALFVDISKTTFLPFAHKHDGSRWTLCQDNDPKHTSRAAKNLYENEDISILDWPSNSPDLNPIENAWGLLKHNVERRIPQSKMQLKEFMVEEWANISQCIVKN